MIYIQRVWFGQEKVFFLDKRTTVNTTVERDNIPLLLHCPPALPAASAGPFVATHLFWHIYKPQHRNAVNVNVKLLIQIYSVGTDYSESVCVSVWAWFMSGPSSGAGACAPPPCQDVIMSTARIPLHSSQS